MFKMYKDVQYSFSDNLINALIAVLFMNSYIYIYILIYQNLLHFFGVTVYNYENLHTLFNNSDSTTAQERLFAVKAWIKY